MTALILTGEQARDLVYDEADPALGLEVEARVRTGSSRWMSLHRLIVKDKDGRLWAVPYQQGLTESQETRPFEDLTEVEFREVERVSVTSYEYRPVTS
jgi:hypothetical protein